LLRLRQTLVLRFGRTQEHYHLNGIGQDHHRDRASIISASESSVAAFQRQKLKGCWEKMKKFWAEWLYGKKRFLRIEPSVRRCSQNP
jgi:hypothetical protein